MRCKHISISKTFHRVKPKYLSVSSLRVYHCVCGCSIAHTNMVLCCWRFTSGSLSSVLNGVYVMLVCVCVRVWSVDPLFIPVWMLSVLLTELWLCLIYYREEMPWLKPNTHILLRLICACVHNTKWEGVWESNNTKKSSGPKSERISDMLCNRVRILYMWLVCK